MSGTTDAEVRGNLLNRLIASRDGAQAIMTQNVVIGVHAASANLGGIFVDLGEGNLHLKATATRVIDRVPFDPLVATDIDGDPRPQGARVDFGADELVPDSAPGALPGTRELPE